MSREDVIIYIRDIYRRKKKFSMKAYQAKKEFAEVMLQWIEAEGCDAVKAQLAEVLEEIPWNTVIDSVTTIFPEKAETLFQNVQSHE